MVGAVLPAGTALATTLAHFGLLIARDASGDAKNHSASGVGDVQLDARPALPAAGHGTCRVVSRAGGLRRPLIALDFNQQRFEADFRYSLVRLRENSEGVALYRGEAEEVANLRNRFSAVIGNWWALMLRRKKLGAFTFSYRQAAVIVPLVVISPAVAWI